MPSDDGPYRAVASQGELWRVIGLPLGSFKKDMAEVWAANLNAAYTAGKLEGAREMRERAANLVEHDADNAPPSGLRGLVAIGLDALAEGVRALPLPGEATP